MHTRCAVKTVRMLQLCFHLTRLVIGTLCWYREMAIADGVSCVCSRKTVYHYRDSVAFDDFPTGQLISSECLLVKKMLAWAWAIFFNVCTNRIVCVLCFQESYRNEAEMVGAFARDTTAGLGIALGCVLLYAIIMSIVASRDCIRQRCRQNFRSNSVSRHSNDAGISIFCST